MDDKLGKTRVTTAEVQGGTLDKEEQIAILKNETTQTDNQQNGRANKATGWQIGRTQVPKEKKVRLIEHPKYTEGEQPYLSLNNRFMLCLK